MTLIDPMFPMFLPVSQDTTLALWIPCALMSAVEAGVSVWCFIVGLALRGLPPCGNSYIKEQVCACVYVSLCLGLCVCVSVWLRCTALPHLSTPTWSVIILSRMSKKKLETARS